MNNLFKALWRVITFPLVVIFHILGFPFRAFRGIRQFLNEDLPEDRPLIDTFSSLATEAETLIRDRRPDVVVVDCMALALVKGANRTGLPVVVLLHTFAEYWRRQPAQREVLHPGGRAYVREQALLVAPGLDLSGPVCGDDQEPRYGAPQQEPEERERRVVARMEVLDRQQRGLP